MTTSLEQTFSAEETADLKEMLARNAIWNCLLRYARGIDRLDIELVRSAFWPDAHDSHGLFNGPPEEFIQWLLPGQPNREVSQHYLMNHNLSFDDQNRARSETYFISVAKMSKSDKLLMLGGRYDDEWQRRDGIWRVSARLVLIDWRAYSNASDMSEHLSGWHRGSRDTSDPSYSANVERR